MAQKRKLTGGSSWNANESQFKNLKNISHCQFNELQQKDWYNLMCYLILINLINSINGKTFYAGDCIILW